MRTILGPKSRRNSNCPLLVQGEKRLNLALQELEQRTEGTNEVATSCFPGSTLWPQVHCAPSIAPRVLKETEDFRRWLENKLRRASIVGGTDFPCKQNVGGFTIIDASLRRKLVVPFRDSHHSRAIGRAGYF